MSLSLSLHLTPLSLHHSSSSSSSSTFKLKNPSPRLPFHFHSKTSLEPLNATKLPSHLPSFKPLSLIKPYVQSHYKPIIAGWLCSVVSVFSLSKIIPKIATLSSNLCVNKLKSDGWILGVFVLARLVATYWQQAFLWDAALGAVYDVRVTVFEKVLQRELSFFEGVSGVSSGDIAFRITAEANDVADAVYALLNTIVPSVLQLSAMATQMLVISPVLSLISALVIPSMALVIAYLGERLRKISKQSHLSIASLSAYLNEVLPAILFVKANNAEMCESARFRRLAHSDLCELLKKRKMKALIPQTVQLIYFGALFILCGGSLLVSGGSFDGCSLVSFITSLVFMIEPIQGVGKAYNEFKQGEPAIERLFDLTKFKSKMIEKPDAVSLDHINGDVKFCNISFKYADNMPLVLDQLNLHIRAGETVALIGPSGGGKSTLAKLLLRLYDPLSGEPSEQLIFFMLPRGCILVDDHDVQNIRLDSLRRHVGLVSQDISSAKKLISYNGNLSACFVVPYQKFRIKGTFLLTLFSGTVAENIGYRDLMTKIDMERVEHAARTANADEFIRTLPQGYNTHIGPRGSSLSGGQRQRLAIARALYQNSSVLILDEATSALDSRCELLVRQAVDRLLGHHTVLVIAHHLETVMMAKRVFLLDNGKLEELNRSTLLGSNHDSLVSAGLVI
ncbi:ABC transporter B family member 29 [Citrus sinensis]|uniref:ABC transporter B family member 29 n=1 Tax=Citrus sinensis TaxID=2711 RepID=A0ACB8K163_CITSI|nr:ABC transporter B family member 29 [Citrus sinensis]